jgi:hypothetical protein
VIYDPLLTSKTSSISPDPVDDSLITGSPDDQVLASDSRDQVVVGDSDRLEVATEVTQVVVSEDSSEVTIQEEVVQLSVSNEDVTVVSASEIGPPGPPGPQGLPGNPYTGVAPIQVDLQALTLQIAPGSINGDGLVWNGSAWAPQVLVPFGVAGTVPYKSGDGYTGDDVNFRYDPSQQALRVTKLDTALLDGGNF